MERVLSIFTKYLAIATAILPSIQLSSGSKINTIFTPTIPGIIPGDSPAKFCNESRSTDLFSIERLSIHPTPLVSEENFAVYIYGTFLKDITPNATWSITFADPNDHAQNETTVHWFCMAMETIEQPNPDHVDRARCPPVKGWAILSVHLWASWLAGTVDAVTKEGERIYCLDGDIEILPERSPIPPLVEEKVFG